MGGRGYHNNTPERSSRFDNNESDGHGARGSFDRGGKNEPCNPISILSCRNLSVGRGGGQSRFISRGHNRGGGHDYASSRRSSRSPDRHFSSYRSDHQTEKYPSPMSSGFSAPPPSEFSHRSLPLEALRHNEQSSVDSSFNDAKTHQNRSSLTIDETISSRSGHAD